MKKVYLIFFLIVNQYCVAQKLSFNVTGKVIGQSMENGVGTKIINQRNYEQVFTYTAGIYKIHVSIGDTLIYYSIGYTKEIRVVTGKKHINVLLINKQVNDLGAIWTKKQYDRAEKQMNEYYKSLEKKADKLGKWNY